jgi:MFS family permease
LPLWGRLVKAIGAASLMWIGGVGITPVAAGWLFSQSIVWLSVLQLVSGVVWGAYELAFFLLFFESIPEEERTSVLTIYNLLNTAAWVAGALAGGLVLAGLGGGYQAYLAVFGLSSLARCFTLLLLARVPQVTVPSDEVGVRTLAVRPGAAGLDAPVLPSLPDQAPKDASFEEFDLNDVAT